MSWQTRSALAEEMAAACKAFFQAHAAALADLDWGDMARPDYAQISDAFSLRPDDLDLAEAQVQGYDAGSDLAVVRFGGPEMPVQHSQVHRFAVLYCVVQSATPHSVQYTVATIEGWVEE